MVAADVAMFTAVSHYFDGVAKIHLAKNSDNEGEAFRKIAQIFQRALEQVKTVNEREAQLLKIAEPIEYSAYYIRRHQVASHGTSEFRRGLEMMVRELADGFYPLQAFTILNPVLARLMAGWDLNARVEGIVTRIERAQPKGVK